ncbi:LysM peptidoglycan-binding domain-containing protein [Streptomyces sp. NBC_01549]|uniref:LysM peptidoglycan-binding domain-containing protein n=1 Tax=Streptomyces sp. NBC_01549 TaxID=2975874 RepID=UPI00225B873F|nr:LysM peptidoglycan-binding domain-containing protein [Streptomyces sp. NBC_01549]MCX4598276.1 LysM peptidoglycan-binding domain-containing protein [Streptomyces sp. NBC_01549]
MRTTPSPAATAGRTLARVLKAVLSLLVLAVAVAGLPLLLAWATPVIWAATHDDLTHLLDRQDTGSVFLLLLVAVGWIGWAQFSFCAVRELIAQLRGRTWHAPRGLGSSQRAAALLIGSILVLLPTSSALASDAQAAPATSAARVPGQAAAPQATETERAQASAASTPASRTTYTVREMRPAESLWGIAEKELGDGERWREIADLNEGRTMVDGTVFRANSFLQPGWQLQMPETAAAAGGVRTQLGDSAPAAGEKDGHVVTVHSGDYLSKIAEEELGDGNEWPQLFEASRGKPQPHGLPEITDPDVVYAGQQVTVPGAETGQPPQDRGQGEESGSQETTPPATQNPDSTQKPGDGTGDAQAPVPSQSATPAPQSSAPSAPSSRAAEQPGQEQASPSAAASATPEPSASASASAESPSASAEPSGSAASSPSTQVPETPATSPASSPLNLRIVLGAGALLAAAITGALALRRTLQRRRRKPGEKIAIASETSAAEAQLAAAAEPGGAARLDVPLRTLAHHVAQQGEDAVLPPLRAARIGTRVVEVLPEDLAQEPVAPFTSGQGGWWVLPADAALLDDEAARDVPAPYPALVTIGSTEAGDLLLLNLAGLPALLLDGNPVHITEVCTSLALELGMSPWAAEVEVVTVGFGEDLPQLLPTARIAHMRQATHALRDLSERLLEAHQMPDDPHQPYLVLCAASLDEDTAWQFADVIDRAGMVPVTLIAPASTAAARFPEAEILNASLSEPQTLDYAGTDITVQRLEHAAYLQITTALKVSGQPSHPAEGPWQDIPDELDSMQSEQASPEEPIVPSPAAAPIPSRTAATEVSGEVFPALLAASTDPSGLRLLSPATPLTGLSDDTGPANEPVAPSAPASPGAADSTDAAEAADAADDPAAAVEESTEAEAEECEAHDLHAPEIRVLGPVEVTGVDSTGHGPRMAQLAALLYFRPGRSADVLCADMDPVSPWSTSTLNARMQGLRSSLGSDSAGNVYVPRRKAGEDPYRLAAGVRCDWTRFLQLVERALPLGPSGLTDLEKALTLVRGKPFGGRPLPWAEPYQQEMITRIIDVAHTVATYRIPAGPHHDLNAARRAVATGLDVDDTAELLYRDWMRLEAARGNRSGLHTAITRVQQVNRALDCSLEMETTQIINELLNGSGTVRKAL